MASSRAKTVSSSSSSTAVQIDDDADDVKGIQALAATGLKGVFGTAFVLSHEGGATSAKVAILFAAIELLQLAVFPLSLVDNAPGLHPIYVATDLITTGSFGRLAESYGFATVLVLATTFVLAFLLMSVVVARRYVADVPQSRSLVRVLRVLANLSVSVLFIPLVGVLMLSFHCEGADGRETGRWMQTRLECGSTAHTVLASTMGLVVALFTVVVVFLAATLVDTSPLSKSWSAKVHGRLDVAMVLVKLVLTFIWGASSSLASDGPASATIPAAAFLLVIGAGWLFLVWSFVPFVAVQMNGVVVAEAGLFTWCAAAAFISRAAPGWGLDPSLMVLLGGPAVTIALHYAFLRHMELVLHLPRATVKDSPAALELWARLRIRKLLNNQIFHAFAQGHDGTRLGAAQGQNDCLAYRLRACREQLAAERHLMVDSQTASATAQARQAGSDSVDASKRATLAAGLVRRRKPAAAAAAADGSLVASASVQGGDRSTMEGMGPNQVSFRANGIGNTDQEGIVVAQDRRQMEKLADDELERRKQLHVMHAVLAGVEQAVDAYEHLATNFLSSELALVMAAGFLQVYSPYEYASSLALHRVTLINPSLDTQFIVFRRIKQLQLRGTKTGGKGDTAGTANTVDRVLLEQNQRQIAHLRLSAYRVTARMWDALAAQVVDLGVVANYGKKLQDELAELERLYKTVLKADPNSTVMLRGFAAFLRDQKHSEIAGQELDNKAERIEEAHQRRRNRFVRQIVLGARYHGKLDESDASSAVIVVSGEPGSLGEISQVSLGACRLLNFRSAQQLVGINIKDVIPEPFRARHDGYLDRFGTKQSSKIVGTASCMFASTSIGTIVPVWLQVNEAPPNPITAAPRFTGVMERISTTEQHLICGTSSDDFQIYAASAGSLDLLGLAADSLKAEDPVSAAAFFPTLGQHAKAAELAIGLRSMQLMAAGTHDNREMGGVESTLEPEDRPRASSWLGPDGEGLALLRTAAQAALEDAEDDSDLHVLAGSVNRVLHAADDQAVVEVAPMRNLLEGNGVIPVTTASSGAGLAAVVFGGLQHISRGGIRCLLIRWRAPTEFLRRHRARRNAAAASRASMGTPSYLRQAAVSTPAVGSDDRLPALARQNAAAAASTTKPGRQVTIAADAEGGGRLTDDGKAEYEGGDDGSVLGSLLLGEGSDQGSESLASADHSSPSLGSDAANPQDAAAAGPLLTRAMGGETASPSLGAMRGAHGMRQTQVEPATVVSFARDMSVDTQAAGPPSKLNQPSPLARVEAGLVNSGSQPGAPAWAGGRVPDPALPAGKSVGRSSRSSGTSAHSSRLATILAHQRKLRDADVSSVKFVMLIVTILVICIGGGDLWWLRATNNKLASLLTGLLQSGDRVIRIQQCTASILEMVASSGGLEGRLFDTVEVAQERFVSHVHEVQMVHEDIYVAGASYGAAASHYEQSAPLMMNELSSEFLGAWLEDSMNNSVLAVAMANDNANAVCPNSSFCDPQAMAFVSLASVDFWLKPDQILEVNALDPTYWYDNTSQKAPYLAPSPDHSALYQQQELLKSFEVVADSFSVPLAQYGEYYASILLRLATLPAEELSFRNRDIRDALGNDENFLRGANVSLQLRAEEITEMLPLIERQLVVAGGVSFFGVVLLQTWLIGLFVSRLASRTRAMLRMLLLVPRRACKQASRLAELRWRRLEQRDSGSSDREEDAAFETTDYEEGLDGDEDERGGDGAASDEAVGLLSSEARRQHESHGSTAVEERLERALVAASNQAAASQHVLGRRPGSFNSMPSNRSGHSAGSARRRPVPMETMAVKLRPHSDSSQFIVTNSMRFVAPTVLILLWLVLLFINQLLQQRSLQSLAERVVVISLLAQSTIGYSTDLVASVLAATANDRMQARLRVTTMDDEILHLADVALFGGAMELTAPDIIVQATPLQDNTGAFGVFVNDGCTFSSELEMCGEVGGGILKKGAYSGLLGLVALGRKLIAALPSPETDPNIPLVFGDNLQIVKDLSSAYHLVEPHLKDSLQGMTAILAEEMNKELDTLWNRALWGTIGFAILFSILSLIGVLSASRLTTKLESARMMMSQVPSAVRQRVPALKQAIKDLITEPDMSIVNVHFDPSTVRLRSTGRSCMGGSNGGSKSSGIKSREDRRQNEARRSASVAPASPADRE